MNTPILYLLKKKKMNTPILYLLRKREMGKPSLAPTWQGNDKEMAPTWQGNDSAEQDKAWHLPAVGCHHLQEGKEVNLLGRWQRG